MFLVVYVLSVININLYWERSEGYPDVTMLPAIANCLGVSVDVLVGNDKIIAEERTENYISEFKQLTADASTWHLTFSVAKNALKIC